MPDSEPILTRSRVRATPTVLFQEVGEQSALLHMESELYFGLDDVGTQMWKVLQEAETIEAAAQQLAKLYDGPPEKIRQDLIDLVRELATHGLVDISAQA